MMRVRYMIGAKCNFHCSYCIITKGTKKFIETENDNVLFDVIDKCRNNGKPVSRLLITGGEPTLYRDRVIDILENVKDIKEVMINTNLTNVDIVKEFLSFDNVGINISWDGDISDRDRSIYNSISDIVNSFDMSRIRINYVVTPTSYTHMVESMIKLDKIKKGLSRQVEHSIISASKDIYDKFDKDMLRAELERVFLYFPASPLFDTRTKNCPHITRNDYIDIQNGEVFYGCCEGICFYDVATEMDRMFYCKDPASDMCMNCDNEFCAVCGLKLDKLSNGLGRNKRNFFCDYYGIIKDIATKYEAYHKFIKGFYKRKMLFEIDLTWDCNLKCSYCYRDDNCDYVMTYDTLDKIINIMAINAYNGDGLNIEFFGGETLLEKCIDKIRYVVDAVHDMGVREPVTINFVTNGTNYSDGVRNLLSTIIEYEFSINIQVSLDGDKMSHDLNRCCSFDTVIKNLYLMHSDFKNINIFTNSVISNDTVDRLRDNALFIDGLKTKGIIKGYSFRLVQGNYEFDYVKFRDSYNNLLNDFKSGLINEELFKAVLQFDSNVLSDNYRGCGMCYNMITFAPNGDIIPCHRLNQQKISNINDISTFDNYFDVIENNCKVCDFYGNDKCSNCRYKHICLKCKAANYDATNNLSHVNSSMCDVVKIIGELLDENNVDFHVEMVRNSIRVSKHNELKDLYSEYEKIKNSLTEEENMKVLQELSTLADSLKEY